MFTTIIVSENSSEIFLWEGD